MAPGNFASDPSERAQDIATALTGAVDSAMRSVVAGLKTEICRRTETTADEQEASRACYRLLQQLLERSQARAQRFEHTVLNYFLRMPEGPSVNSLDEPSRDEGRATATASAGIPRGDLADSEVTGLAVRPMAEAPAGRGTLHLDEEIAEVEAQLVQSMHKAAALKKEASELTEQLSLLEAAEAAAGESGLENLANEIAHVARQVNKLTGKENRDYFGSFNQKAVMPKRRGFLDDWEEEDAPWPETPKRPRFGLLG